MEPLRSEKSEWQKLNERLTEVAGHSTYITTDPGPFDDKKAPAWVWGDSIYFRPELANPLLKLKKGWVAPPPGQRRRFNVAFAIYALAHEIAHLSPGGGDDPEKVPDGEKRANMYAARKFFYYARRFGLDDKTIKLLWRSLPDAYRKVQ